MDHCVEQINDQQSNQHREHIICHLTCPVCVSARDEARLSPAAHDMLSSLLSGWGLTTLSANITRAPQMAKRPSASNSINASSNTVCTFLLDGFQRIAPEPTLIWVKRVRHRDYIKHKFAMPEYLCRTYATHMKMEPPRFGIPRLYASNIHVLVERFQNSNHMGSPKGPHFAVASFNTATDQNHGIDRLVPMKQGSESAGKKYPRGAVGL
jgi:hypothetical protein